MICPINLNKSNWLQWFIHLFIVHGISRNDIVFQRYSELSKSYEKTDRQREKCQTTTFSNNYKLYVHVSLLDWPYLFEHQQSVRKVASRVCLTDFVLRNLCKVSDQKP